MINKKSVNQYNFYNFQRVKHHAINDHIIRHEDSHLKTEGKVNELCLVIAF